MKRLSLLRHAKSSWTDPAQEDFDRPLNARGRAAAPLMAQTIAARGLTPDFILASTALRTRETAALMTPEFAAAPRVEYRDDLYLAEPKTVLAAVRERAGEAVHVMVIGHNPGLEMLAFSLADPDASDPAALARLASKFPTAALASFIDDIADWSALATRRWALDVFLTPKDLTRED